MHRWPTFKKKRTIKTLFLYHIGNLNDTNKQYNNNVRANNAKSKNNKSKCNSLTLKEKDNSVINL